jgi:tetratricopeptide (TPR) repeat protein
MPGLQEAVAETLTANPKTNGVAATKLGAKLDDASIATGAALLGKLAFDEEARLAALAAADESRDEEVQPVAPAVVPAAGSAGRLGAAELAAAVELERSLTEIDRAAFDKSEARNALESFVLESRNLTTRKHGHLIDGSKLGPLLDEAEDWIYSDECDAADLAGLNAKFEEVRDKVAVVTEAFVAKVEGDKKAQEAQLEKESAAAAAERAANGEDEDHDQRKLKFPDRLRLVSKNKEEGTELFQGGNHRQAMARYNKALTHAAKFGDLSPQQTEEVSSLKLSCHLNIAACWLKITDAENHLAQAMRSCSDALGIDPESVKALYRRATAAEQKGDYEDARQDLVKAAKLDPDDKAVPKLMTRVEAQIKRQAAKEKKMYGKMFG